MEQATGRYKRRLQVINLLVALALVVGLNIDTALIARHLALGVSGFPVGWPGNSAGNIVGRIPGWVLSTAAVSLGAPFWFDVINKVVNLRQTGLPPDEDPRAGRMIAHACRL
jgi:hypothetical protein